MKGLILNSGSGSRMGELTLNKPKCLVEIGADETILSRQIKQLVACGITDIIMTTGPFKGMIQKYLEKEFPHITLTYVQNDDYLITNYIYSMYLADKYIREDLILMHGDIVVDTKVLSELIESSEPNLVLVEENAPLPKKDFKARIKDQIVTEIGLELFGKDCNFLLPVYKLNKKSMGLWMDEINKFKERNDLKVYAENAFNNISDSMNLKPMGLNGKLCMEIDNPEDHKKATKLLKGI